MAESKRRGDDTAAENDDVVDADLDELLDDEVDEDEASEGDAKSSKVAAGKVDRKSTDRKAKTGEKGPGIFGRLGRFVREIVAELRKVIWPTRKELLTYTSVVIVFVAIMVTVVGLLDLGFAKLMLLVFGA